MGTTRGERRVVERERSETKAFSPLVGGDILGLVTSGMYDNPLALYREYIQNVADAAASGGRGERSTVEIEIDPATRRVRIRDHGPGLSHRAAIRALVPIARSGKRRGIDRGFRGIGRLAGLAFAESVTFTTRSVGERMMTRIRWDGRTVRGNSVVRGGTDDRIAECVDVKAVSAQEHPDHFFEVEIGGIGRHVAGVVLNRDAVRSYIGQACPVPFSPEFPFAEKVDSLVGSYEWRPKLNVVFDGDRTPVTRPHGNSIPFPKDRISDFTELETVQIPSLDGEGAAAVGWIGHSTYVGAIPKSAGIRGLRARCGDIQVGDESVFDGLFKEDRFNRWCVGEIHIVDPRIVPNGRRDYFEMGPHVRHLENQLGPVAREIAARCRTASVGRNRERRLVDELSRVEDTYDLASAGYLARTDAEAMATRALHQASEVRRNIGSWNTGVDEYIERIEALERQLSNLQVRPEASVYGDALPVEIATYQRTFQALAAVSRSPRAARELIEAVVAQARVGDAGAP